MLRKCQQRVNGSFDTLKGPRHYSGAFLPISLLPLALVSPKTANGSASV